MKIEHILHNIDYGTVALPEFQRGYVWNRDQVRGLMHSLYRRYPIGSLLRATASQGVDVRGPDGPPSCGRLQRCDGPLRLPAGSH